MRREISLVALGAVVAALLVAAFVAMLVMAARLAPCDYITEKEREESYGLETPRVETEDDR